jgi:tetratricopeptide (TPR) repeat protein
VKKTISYLSLLMLAALLYGPMLPAQEDDQREQREAELARAESFRAGFQEVVDDLNSGSFERFTKAIDQPDMLDRIFALRLIDQRVKKQFRENFEFAVEPMVKAILASGDDGVKATLLGFDSRGEFGRATVRYDLPDFQYNYHEYDLRLNKHGGLTIVDWTDFLQGEKFSDGVGETLIMAAPGDSAVRKLLDFKNVRQKHIFQMAQLLKAARDHDVDRYFEILESLDEQLQRQRIAVLTTVHLTKQVRKRRKLRTALIAMAKYFPEEPLYSLMLLDYYFPSRRYEEALQALLRLEKRLGVEDGAMKARLSAAALVAGNVEDASSFADRAINLEPGLELGWWSTLQASIVMSHFDTATEALAVLEKQFGRSLDPEAFQKDKSFAGLLASPEYKKWLASRE